MTHSKRGFALVELLTVVAIVGILSGISLVGITQARARARDDQRIRDIKLIQNSLELYRTDIDRSTDIAADAGRYAYPVRTSQSQLGIYGDTRFAKYLTKTPIDPLRKTNYVYYAPACLHPALSPTDAVIVTPAKDSAFHTTKQIRDGGLGAYCAAGSGWVPYVVYGVLEKPISGKSRSSNLANLANSTLAVAHSITKPIFATDADTTNASPTVTMGASYCYPAVGACGDGFSVTPTPSSSATPTTTPTMTTTLGPTGNPTSTATTTATTTTPPALGGPSPSPSTSTSMPSPVASSPSPFPSMQIPPPH
jgi:prepilin-type N-terminal cleavage/methylation domain-containing protein